MIGQTFNRLTVLSVPYRLKNGVAMWECRCSCGNVKILQSGNVKRGDTQSCGCLRREVKRKDITGQRFGRLLVESIAGSTARKQLLWNCRCDCGVQKIISGNSLRMGKTVSCGCFRREILSTSGIKHGGSSLRAFRAWQEMLRRCRDPNRPAYKDYGGRGIDIATRWLDFTEFLADMGECPPGLTLERKNVNGNYEHGNCEWATKKAQSRNTRRTIYVEAFGQRVKLIDVCERFGVGRALVGDRINVLGWSVETALTTPKRLRCSDDATN